VSCTIVCSPAPPARSFAPGRRWPPLPAVAIGEGGWRGLGSVTPRITRRGSQGARIVFEVSPDQTAPLSCWCSLRLHPLPDHPSSLTNGGGRKKNSGHKVFSAHERRHRRSNTLIFFFFTMATWLTLVHLANYREGTYSTRTHGTLRSGRYPLATIRMPRRSQHDVLIHDRHGRLQLLDLITSV
jgi:hypothetical protein